MEMAFFSSRRWVTIFSRKHKHAESAMNSPLFPQTLFEFYHQLQYLNTSADIYIQRGFQTDIRAVFSTVR